MRSRVKTAAVLACLLLTGCAVHRRVVAWPPPEQVAAWQWSWHVEDAEGCNYREFYVRLACSQRHGVKL